MTNQVGITIEIKGLDEWLKRCDKAPEIIHKHLKKGLTESVITIEGKVKPLVPVGVSGRLRNSIGSEVIDNGTMSLTGLVGSSLKGEVYPKVIEFGRAPGSMPPPQALERWVHVKHIAGTYSIKSHRRMGKKAIQEDEDTAAAKAIAWAIYKRGIKARHYLGRGFEASLPKVKRFFEDSVADAVTEIKAI